MNSNRSEHVVEVLLPVATDGGFDYLVPEGMHVVAGDYVQVPFGRKESVGVVWGPGKGEIAHEKLKPIRRKLEYLPPISDRMRAWLDWVAWYTVSARGMVLKMVLASGEGLEPPAEIAMLSLSRTPPANAKMTDSRRKVIATLEEHVSLPAAELRERSGISANVIREMVKSGWLVETKTRAMSAAPVYSAAFVPELSAEQAIAAETLLGKVGAGFSVTLLDGVTGSGKTEVYFDMMEAALKQERQVLVLLPEIALTVQWLKRFEQRFGFAPHLWHSSMTSSARKATWQAVANGTARIVVGARSALFLPYPNLSLIVVDEEHEPSYKQEDGVIYHARDMAIARAREEKFPIVLVSATPSLETWHNVVTGKYAEVRLPERFFDSVFPDVALVDMREQPLRATEFISMPLRSAIAEAMARKEQSLLFLNRRGYAPLMLCRACGHRFQCPQCSAWLILHRHRSQLLCHHCGYHTAMPNECPSCKAEGTLHACGPGVERIAEEVEKLFPDARLAVLTSDSMDSPKAAEVLINQIMNREADILVGTQIIAKGHHFPGLQLVGVIDADIGLSGGDPRAAERTYQLLHQLSGRAGRETMHGKVLIQTYQPEHAAIKAMCSGDRGEFMKMETISREEGHLPPFGRLVAIILEGRDEPKLISATRLLARYMPTIKDIRILGPAPAPLSLLRGWHRQRFLVMGPKQLNLQAVVRQWLDLTPLPSTIKVKVDVDPMSFL